MTNKDRTRVAANIHEKECTAYEHEGRNGPCERQARAAMEVLDPIIDEHVQQRLRTLVVAPLGIVVTWDVKNPEQPCTLSLADGYGKLPTDLPEPSPDLITEMGRHKYDTMSQDSGRHCVCGSDSRFEQNGRDKPWSSFEMHLANVAVAWFHAHGITEGR